MRLFILLGFVLIAQSARLTIENNSQETIWIGINSSSVPPLNISGFVLTSFGYKILNMGDNWKGKIWPRTGCNNKTFVCETGDCGKFECQGKAVNPPYTLVDIEYKQGIGTFNISLVQGYNMGVQVSKDLDGCNEECVIDIERDCPKKWKFISKNGNAVGCRSNCDVFKIDQYCCTGIYGTPDKCDPNQWALNLPGVLKAGCKTAITYPLDQPTRMCTHGNSSTIVFGRDQYMFVY